MKYYQRLRDVREDLDKKQLEIAIYYMHKRRYVVQTALARIN